jgi:cellulose synthase/poly-beta-1,6-N-acetylglucosamine synthase-like glycosyltransferase
VIVLQMLALAIACGVLVPLGVLAVELLSAVLPGTGRNERPSATRPRCAVLVPAHDEEGHLGAALASIAPQLAIDDRLVVVAHNCRDGTAEVACAAGAEVVVAIDDGRGGKPDALKAGLRYLDSDPPTVVVILDADCRARPGALDALVKRVAETGGPVQGVYLFRAAGERRRLASLSSLALLVKNHVRPLGLHALGLPCLLNGSGSAYPFELLRRARHGEGSIAEDYQLSVDLALAGHPTRLCPTAYVESTLPRSRAATLAQRRRWEHGHLELCVRTAPRLALAAVRQRRPELLALALELAVPPLSVLALTWVSALGFTIAGASLGDPLLPAEAIFTAGSVFLLLLLVAWARFAGLRTTLRALVLAPAYVLWKVPLYIAWFRDREKSWRKTSREPDHATRTR